MNCPSCDHFTTYVSRTLAPEPDRQRRIRRCSNCGHEFTTTEYADDAPLIRKVQIAETIGEAAQRRANALRLTIERSLA